MEDITIKIFSILPQGIPGGQVNMAIKVAISGKSNIEIAATFRQSNDQVDVWDMQKVQRIEQFKVSIV